MNGNHDHLYENAVSISCQVQNLRATIRSNGRHIGENSNTHEQRHGGRDEGVGALKRIGRIGFPEFIEELDFDGCEPIFYFYFLSLI